MISRWMEWGGEGGLVLSSWFLEKRRIAWKKHLGGSTSGSEGGANNHVPNLARAYKEIQSTTTQFLIDSDTIEYIRF